MKKTLEKKILKKIYRYETKKTFADVLFQMLMVVSVGLLIFFFGWLLIDSLEEQQTLEFISIVSQEIGIMKSYWFDVASIFLSELPLDLTIFLTGTIIVFISTCFVILKNIKKIGRKLTSLFRYWKS